MKYSKDQYILRNLSKIRHKPWELFIISRIIHNLNDSEIEFVCQQPVRTNEGIRYLDLCFPNLHLYLEIDEFHHLKDTNVVSDQNRKLEILDVTSFVEKRIRIYDTDGNDKSLNNIISEIDNLIALIKTIKEKLLSKDEFIPWDYNNKYSPESHIKKGYLDVKDNVGFLNHRDALKCFGYTGGHYQKAGWGIPNSNKSIWFPKFFINDSWINLLSDDFETISMAAHPDSDWACNITEDTYKKLITTPPVGTILVFGFFKDVLGQTIYKFLGEFIQSVEESDVNKIIFKRINTRINLFNL